jgi:Glyoxalase/Bleomycin resistance protein/Dioxygenase superfamily.
MIWHGYYMEVEVVITFGNIYIITKDFDGALDFYKKLFEKDVAAQNKTRYASFQLDGLNLAILNGKFDRKYPDEVLSQGEYCCLYDDMDRIMDSENCGKLVINICTDDLEKEYQRIKQSGIGNSLTGIRYVNAGNPYWYFLLKDLDGNTIEITGNYNTNENIKTD